METVVVIERKTFEEIMARFNRLVNRVDEIRRKSEAKRLGEWLDSSEVCRILQVSPRTLQTLRSNGTLGYSQIVRKVYYRAEDVQRRYNANTTSNLMQHFKRQENVRKC